MSKDLTKSQREDQAREPDVFELESDAGLEPFERPFFPSDAARQKFLNTLDLLDDFPQSRLTNFGRRQMGYTALVDPFFKD